MKKMILTGFLLLAILLATIGTAAASSSKTAFRAELSDETGTNSDAHGTAVFIFSDDGNQVFYKLVVNGLDNPTMAHIHVAPSAGQNGPPVLWLYPDAPPPTLIPGVFNGLMGSRRVTSDDLTGAAGITSLEELRAAILEGRAYVNVHTTAFPGGEIRGDVR